MNKKQNNVLYIKNKTFLMRKDFVIEKIVDN